MEKKNNKKEKLDRSNDLDFVLFFFSISESLSKFLDPNAAVKFLQSTRNPFELQSFPATQSVSIKVFETIEKLFTQTKKTRRMHFILCILTLYVVDPTKM